MQQAMANDIKRKSFENVKRIFLLNGNAITNKKQNKKHQDERKNNYNNNKYLS